MPRIAARMISHTSSWPFPATWWQSRKCRGARQRH